MENTYSKVQELLHQKADYTLTHTPIAYSGQGSIKQRSMAPNSGNAEKLLKACV